MFTLSDAFGYFTHRELSFLSYFVKKLSPDSQCVILGSGVGTSSVCLLQSNPKLILYSIDHIAESPFGGLQNELNALESVNIPYNPDRHHLILGDSIQIGKEWRSKYPPIDFILFDTAYDTQTLSDNFKAWSPHFRISSTICFHQYDSPQYPDVKPFVDEAMSKYTQMGTEGRLIVFQGVKPSPDLPPYTRRSDRSAHPPPPKPKEIRRPCKVKDG